MKSEKRQKLELKLAESKRRIYELEAQLAKRLGGAFDVLHNAGIEQNMGSGVILSITGIGGKSIVPPVMIRDGISKQSVTALQDDICRSFEIATMVSPAMARTPKESN